MHQFLRAQISAVAFLSLFAVSFPLAAQGAVETGSLTHELDGVEVIYGYADGSHYDVKYTPAGIRYRFLSGDAPGDWWGPFPYRAFKTSHGEYFLGWYEKGYGDQITHLVNLEAKTLYGSGIIVKKDQVIEHFQKAKIEKIIRSPMPKP